MSSFSHCCYTHVSLSLMTKLLSKIKNKNLQHRVSLKIATSSSSSSSSSLSPSNSPTTCNLAENRQRRANAGSGLPQILATERDLSLPMKLSDGAAGNFSATITGRSDDICNEEFDDLHADPLQVHGRTRRQWRSLTEWTPAPS